MKAVLCYITSSGDNPVKDFLESLSKLQKAKVFRIFQHIEAYGLISVVPHIKKLTGTPLWEIRVLGQDNIRILYVTAQNNRLIFLHGFLKKTQKTSFKEISVAIYRLKDWQNRQAGIDD